MEEYEEAEAINNQIKMIERKTKLGLFPAQLLGDQIRIIRQHLKELIAGEDYEEAQLMHDEVVRLEGGVKTLDPNCCQVDFF